MTLISLEENGAKIGRMIAEIGRMTGVIMTGETRETVMTDNGKDLPRGRIETGNLNVMTILGQEGNPIDHLSGEEMTALVNGKMSATTLILEEENLDQRRELTSETGKMNGKKSAMMIGKQIGKRNNRDQRREAAEKTGKKMSAKMIGYQIGKRETGMKNVKMTGVPRRRGVKMCGMMRCAMDPGPLDQMLMPLKRALTPKPFPKLRTMPLSRPRQLPKQVIQSDYRLIKTQVYK